LKKILGQSIKIIKIKKFVKSFLYWGSGKVEGDETNRRSEG
jgi:hypothetical protein